MRDDYLAKIDKIPDSSYNKEQKQLAKEILKTVPEKDLDEVYGFITQRVKTGFVFDEALKSIITVWLLLKKTQS